jgi:type VI secretion system protein ImpH
MALTGMFNPMGIPASRLLALLQPMLLPTHTADGVAVVIRSQAPNIQVRIMPRCPVDMPISKRARMSIDGRMTLGEHSVLGDSISVANYSIGVELSTEDADEVKGWMPNGKLRKDVFALLRTYLGVDYDLSPHLTLPTCLLPRPRLGDRDLFSGYNIMLGLRDDNEEQMPETIRVRVGRVRKVELLTKKLPV